MALEFDNIINFRDVGKTVNDFLGGRRIVKEGVLYRSARPDDGTPRDRERLRDELGIKTVIDLRTKTEHARQAEKRQADMRVPALLQSNAALAEPMQIPGLRYLECKITGGRFETFLLGQLSWLSFFQVIILYVLGYRMQAVSIVSRDVMVPRGLVGMGLDTVDQSGGEIAEALRTLTEPASLPLLVHCTQGKDRTGLIVIIVLMALAGNINNNGNDDKSNALLTEEAINHDYLLSRHGFVGPERDARLAEIREMGLTPEWLGCPEDLVSRLHRHVASRYGGINGYLDGIGFGADERRRLVEALGA
ncbi:hypothetical protein SLS62_008121 [Diatrype stigma]|uniref:Tyrosine specific protein phosphatases domain-containing protein n=1 Tax=Diatrype stigma TaxID=117547 RepID=A0AAN9UW99_9PEZI